MSEALALLPVLSGSGSGSSGASFIAAISHNGFSVSNAGTVANWNIASDYSNWTFAFVRMNTQSWTNNGNYSCDTYMGLQIAFNGAETPADSIVVRHYSGSASMVYTASIQFAGSTSKITIKVLSFNITGITVTVLAGAFYLLG